MAARVPALSGETDFFLQFMDHPRASTSPAKPGGGGGGLDHLDNLCRLMDQLSQLREQNTRLQTRVRYLETLQESLGKTSPILEEEIGKPGSAWGRMKTILSRKETHVTEGEASTKWRKMKRVLMTKKSQSAILQRSHSVPSSPTTSDSHSNNGDSKHEVLVRTNAGEFRFQGVSDTFRRRLVEWEKKKGVAPDSSCLAFLQEEETDNKPKLERNRSYSDSDVTTQDPVAPRSTSEPQLPPKNQEIDSLGNKDISCRELQKQVDTQLKELQEQVRQLETMVNERNELLNQLLTSQTASSSPKLDFASAFSTAIYDDEALQIPTSPEPNPTVSVTVKLPSRDIATSVTLPPPKTVPPPRVDNHHPSVPLPSRLEPALKVKSMVAHFNNHSGGSPQLQRPPPPEGVLKSSSFCSNQSTAKIEVVKSVSSTSVFQCEAKQTKSKVVVDGAKMTSPNPLPMSPRSMSKRCRSSSSSSNNNSNEICSPPASPRTRPVPSPRVTRLKLRHARDEFLYRSAQDRLTIHEEQIRRPESPIVVTRRAETPSTLIRRHEILMPTMSVSEIRKSTSFPPSPTTMALISDNSKPKQVVSSKKSTSIPPSPTTTPTSMSDNAKQQEIVQSQKSTSFLSFHLRRPKKQQQPNIAKVCRQSLFVTVPATDIIEEANRQSCPTTPEQQPRNQQLKSKSTSWFSSTYRLFRSK